MVLQDCLVGKSKAIMLVNLSSDGKDYSQTLNTLKFAQQVKKVEGLNK